MKHHKKQYRRILIGMLLLGSTAAIMNACAWDDSLYQEFVIEDGKGGHVESCGDVLDKIIIYNDGTMITYYNDGTMITNYNDGTQDAPISSDGVFANAFAYNLCPKAAPNCIIEEISDTEVPEVPEDTEAPEDTESPEESEDTSTTKFICHNCPANYNVCKNKCVETTQTNLHIKNCILDNLECDGDYYDFNKDSSDGCEFQLSINHVKENDAGTLVCVEDYFDLNKDLNNDDSSNGCEFHLSPVNIDKTRPQNSDGSWNCVNGYADLDGDRYSGCEVNGWTDNAHCGAGIINDHNQRREGEACNDGYVCKSGKCEESCGKDYIVVCDGLCSNTMIDNAHCGGCNRTCSLTANDTRAAVACQDGGCHAIACQPGYYLADADEEVEGKILKTCKPCAEGEYTTRATDTACIACPTTTGAKSMVFDANNNICKAASCKPGYVLEDGSCEPCEAGSVSFNGQCIECSAGTYPKDNECTNCPEGSYCPTAGLTSPIDCPKGHYCTAGSSEPVACPAGTSQNNTGQTSQSSCTTCGDNEISTAGSAECAECKGNTYANDDHTACVGCNENNVNEECATTTGAASMKCEDNICKAATCNAGYKLVTQLNTNYNNQQCEPCEAGTFSSGLVSGVTAKACTKCDENNFSGRAASSCTKCPAGTHTVGNDRTKCTALECGKNQHIHGNSCEEDDENNCGAHGKKCTAPANGISQCTNGQCVYTCYAGYYWKDNKCQSCPAGSYCPTAGLTSPIDCPKGHYCTAGVTEPTACPEGTYRNTKNGKSVSDCSNCPKGRHNDGVGAWICALIPAGYVGINCYDESKKEGCVQYSMCYEANDLTNCSKMYGSNSACVSGYCMSTTNTSSTSCIVEHPGCPAVACCGGTCATNNDNCGSCGTECTDNQTCQEGSDKAWKCLSNSTS